MLLYYFKTAWRNLVKHKGITAINILGLSIGMAVFLLIALYVQFERSYENFIPNAEQIYRVKLERYVNNERILASAENYPGAGPALKTELPEVLGFARLYNLGYKNNVIITNEEAKPEPVAFKHRRFLYADSAFLTLMGYPMLKGNAATALAEPLTAVISASYAIKYFGKEDPLGKTLHLKDDDYNDELVRITGVFQDLPPNTHLKFDILFSYKTLFGRGDWAPARYDQSWQRKDMYTFVQLKPGTDPARVEAKLPAIVDKYNPKLKEQNRKDVLALQPLRDIHLRSDLAEEPEPNGDERVVRFIGLIGIFVLVIAWINYINLSTARAMERAREVGVRKVVGAVKNQLVAQFVTESLLVNSIALVLALVQTALALPLFNSISGLELNRYSLLQPWFLYLVPALGLFGALLSGFYPALVLSSFQPFRVLKGQYKNSSGGNLLRKGLVVAQFAASTLLIIGTMVIYRQINYLLDRDLGMNIDQVLVVERPGISPRDRGARNAGIDAFRAELQQIPQIEAVSASVTVPGKQREFKAQVRKIGANEQEAVSVRFNSMDYHFADVFKMKLIAGRLFAREFPKDPDTSAVISESAVRLLGFKSPADAIGQTITIPDFQWNPIIVGVVNDYHQVSLKKALDPMVFYCSPYGGEYYSIRMQTGQLTQTLESVQLAWKKAFPGNPFDHFFLDDYFNRQYENERRFGRLTIVFAFLAIFVGCLGLFALSGYTITQRTKEIGIRKVLGASVGGVVGLLSRDFMHPVLLGLAVAIPVSWYTMNRWLENFAYRIDINWWVFALAGATAVGIAFLTVSFQSIKAALANPVTSLRNE